MIFKKCKICSSNLQYVINDVFDTRFGIDSSFDVVFCPSCNIVKTLSIPSSTNLKKIYENYYNFVGEKNGSYEKFRSAFYSIFFHHFWALIDGDISFYSHRGKGRLLDLGCNEGRGLHIYQKNGFKSEGLEINDRAGAEARKRGFNVFNKSIEHYNPKKSYNVVVLSNVLEHSYDPGKMLGHVNRVLKPGGEVWISCPNIESWQRRLFGRYWINWHVPFHIFHFSENTLSKLLNDNGFKIIKEKQQSPSLWLTQSIICRFFSKPNRATKHLRKAALVAPLMIFIRFLLFPLLWIGNLMNKGDCLVVIAKKV